MAPERNPAVDAAAEKHLKAIAKNALYSVAGSVLSLISAPLSGIITTRALGADLYGVYTLATYWTNLMAEISLLGLGGTVIRFTAAYRGEERPDKIKGALALAARTGLAISAFLTTVLFFRPEILCAGILRRPESAPAFRFFAFNILLTTGYAILMAGLTGLRQQRAILLSQAVFGNLVKIGSLLILALAGFKLYAALASSLLQDLTLVVLCAFFLFRVFPALRDRTLAPVIEGRRLWKYSLTTFSTSLFNKYSFQMDLMILGLYRPMAEVGLYGVALRLQPLIYMPHYALMQIFGPIVAELHVKGERAEMATLYKTVTKWTMSFSLPIFLTIAYFHRPVLSLFGKEFQGAMAALIILGVGNSIADAFGLAGQVISMIGRPAINLANSIITTVVSLGLYLWLIPAKGLVGAATGFTVSITLLNAIRLVQVRRILGLHPFKKSLGKVLAAAAAAAAVIPAFRLIPGKPAFASGWPVELVLLWAVFAAVVIGLGLDAEDLVVWRALRTRLPFRKRQ